MSLSKHIAFGVIAFLLGASLFAQADKDDSRQPPDLYLGQTPPDLAPKVFAPGVVSVPNRYTYDLCVSRDGRECYFTVRNSSWTSYEIKTARFENGRWTEPVRASFSNTQSMSPSLADNDQTIYFSRNQRIWKARRSADGWDKAELMQAPLSSTLPDYSCSVSDLGNAWICSHRPAGVGKCDLWRITTANGQFTEAADIRSLNSMANDCIPLPGPKEAYVLWSSERPGGAGKMDVYISYADGRGGWTSPENLGSTFNTSAHENAASLSPDQKYLFFSRETSDGSDIYWVSIKAFLNEKKIPAATK